MLVVYPQVGVYPLVKRRCKNAPRMLTPENIPNTSPGPVEGSVVGGVLTTNETVFEQFVLVAV